MRKNIPESEVFRKLEDSSMYIKVKNDYEKRLLLYVFNGYFYSSDTISIDDAINNSKNFNCLGFDNGCIFLTEEKYSKKTISLCDFLIKNMLDISIIKNDFNIELLNENNRLIHTSSGKYVKILRDNLFNSIGDTRTPILAIVRDGVKENANLYTLQGVSLNNKEKLQFVDVVFIERKTSINN